jgi:hypothetical protein
VSKVGQQDTNINKALASKISNLAFITMDKKDGSSESVGNEEMVQIYSSLDQRSHHRQNMVERGEAVLDLEADAEAEKKKAIDGQEMEDLFKETFSKKAKSEVVSDEQASDPSNNASVSTEKIEENSTS